jgi:redox-sensitive bicupin YhaK (pirin superfamily)
MSIIETILQAPVRDLGDGFQVRRSLPATARRSVGPFVFFDQMGPVRFRPGTGLDVRPHPHIGLATVTYLFDGEIQHRDSIGNVQSIRPGEVNWMIAGRGIAHSERTAPIQRQSGSALSGIQCWIGLPRDREEMAPSFRHHAADTLPVITGDGTVLRLIAGSLLGARSPVETLSPLFYADVSLRIGARLPLDTEYPERALHVVEGTIDVAGERVEPGHMVVLRSSQAATLTAHTPVRVMLLGGAPLDGPRHLWWNFVSSSRERIDQAKSDWHHRRFAPVPGDDEFIPLPSEPAAAVKPASYP